jgi:hypothetical protein
MTNCCLLPEDFQFPHPGAQGTGIETKEFCRPVFTLDSPTGFLEYQKDVVMFQLG